MAVKTETRGVSMDEIMRRLKDAAVTVGIHSDMGAHKESEGMTVAAVAAINEFGGGNVPERSFLRSTINEQRKAYIETMGKVAASAIKGKYTPERGMGLLGRRAQDDIKAKITAINTPPNAESTKRQKKGADNPLIDTRQMTNSVRWKHEQ